jgi:hypothetical protein
VFDGITDRSSAKQNFERITAGLGGMGDNRKQGALIS